MVARRLTKFYNHIDKDLIVLNEANGVIEKSGITCSLGDYATDPEEKLLYLCVNGLNKQSKFDTIDLDGVFCRDFCPEPGQMCVREGFTRLFSSS